MKLVLMCGGVGTKLWPESRESRPKHFLPLLPNGKSLFEDNLEWLVKNFGEDVWIQTNIKQLPMVRKFAPDFPQERIIVESSMKNHGAATALLCHTLAEKFGPEEIFFNVQADLYRRPFSAFGESIKLAEKLVQETGKLVTGGVRPQFFVEGVDYMIANFEAKIYGDIKVFTMNTWLGRDKSIEIHKYKGDNAVFLHWNHYTWKVGSYLEACKSVHPEWAEKDRVLKDYDNLPSGPAEDVTASELAKGLVIELPFDCWDFGTWKSIYEFAKLHPNVSTIDANGNLIRSKKRVEIVGLENLAVVETEDAILVVPINQSDRVGEVVKKLKAEGKTELV